MIVDKVRNSADQVWTFHIGWALFSFTRLVLLSWRLCMRERGRTLLGGDTMNMSVTFNLTFGDPPEQPPLSDPMTTQPEQRVLH